MVAAIADAFPHSCPLPDTLFPTSERLPHMKRQPLRAPAPEDLSMNIAQHPDSFHSKSTLTSGSGKIAYFSLAALSEYDLSKLPFSLRILLENLLRHEDGRTVTADDIRFLAQWDASAEPSRE